MERKPKIVITLPAYRAERTLEKTVADIPSGVREELILVDDASPDNTAALARSLGITVHVHPQNTGYGGNQKTCYTMALESGADVVVLLHPDYQYEPKAVPLLIAPILAGDADMTFGSRFAGLGDPRAGGMPRYRYIGNRLTTVTQNLLVGSRFTEMHSGMRAYTRECLLALPFLSYPDDFIFDARLLIDAVTGGQRVVEVPIPTRYTKESSSIAVSPSLRYVIGGLVHALRSTLTRGRRRGRRAISVMEAGPSSPSFGGWLLQMIASYATAGRTIRVVGPGPAGFAESLPSMGWEATQEAEAAAGVVFISTDRGAARSEVAATAAGLQREGLLVVVGPDADDAISETDARVVGCYAPSRREGRSGRCFVAVGRINAASRISGVEARRSRSLG